MFFTHVEMSRLKMYVSLEGVVYMLANVYI